jgi:hypothetical protein
VKNRRLVLFLLAAPMMLLGPVGAGSTPPPVYVVDQFNGPSSINSWFAFFQPTPISFAYDSANAGGGAAGSGSMKITADFSSTKYGFGIARTLSGVPWNTSVSVPNTAYAYLSMDIRWDPSSVLDGNGMLPSYAPATFNSGWGIQSPANVVASPSGNFNWVHVVVPLTATTTAPDVAGFIFWMWGTDASGPLSINKPVTCWIDNAELTNNVPEPGSFALLTCGGLFLLRLRRSVSSSRLRCVALDVPCRR